MRLDFERVVACVLLFESLSIVSSASCRRHTCGHFHGFSLQRRRSGRDAAKPPQREAKDAAAAAADAPAAPEPPTRSSFWQKGEAALKAGDFQPR